MTATSDPNDEGGGAVPIAAAVLGVHLLVNAAHGVTHAALPVVLPGWLLATVVLTIYVLPVAGVVLLWRGPARFGGAVFTVSIAASFFLAGVLHFAVSSPDHVSAIPAGSWQLPFRATAAAVAAVDAVCTVVGVRLWRDLDADQGGDLPQSGRVDGVPATGLRPLTRLSYWVSRRWVGDVPEPLTVTAHHAKLSVGTNALEIALDSADRVDGDLKELALVKTAMVVGCEFCIDIGASLATDHGVTERQLRDLRDFEASDAFSDRERLVLRYAVATTATPAGVSEELFEALAAEFDEAELVELTATVAYENFRARFNHAFGIDAQGFAEGAFCPRPERPSRDPSAPPNSLDD